MFILRLIAVVFLIFTFIAVGVEVLGLVRTGQWNGLTAGQLWMSFHAQSLDGAQSFVQRYFYPVIWEPGIAWILRQPAWLVTGVPGVGLLWLDLSISMGTLRNATRPKARAG
jgi:hypothetical protein